MDKPYVVPGEAPESDSEEEINYPVKRTFTQNQPRSPNMSQGIIVVGEAPESDEEEDTNSASVSSVPSDELKPSKPVRVLQEGLQYKTLLHRKLRERNIYLQKDLTEFIRQTVAAAGRELNVTNQQLVRSQIQLQETVSALKLLHIHTTQLDSKLAAVLSSSFLPQISITDW